MEPHLYNIDIIWQKERKGIMCSPELTQSNETVNKCIEIATPPEFPKGIPGIWSPEHLFTAAVSSCFMTTFLAIAENYKLEFLGFNCKAHGKLEEVEGKPVMSEIILEPVVILANDMDTEKAQKVLRKSEMACLISNSVKSKISMIAKIEISN